MIGTVIVPTVLLTLYGVMAIRNQQAHIEDQVRKDQQQRIGFAVESLFARIDALDSEVRSGTDEAVGVQEVWRWSQSPPPALAGMSLPPPQADGTVWFSPPDGGAAIGLYRGAGVHVAWQLDITALTASMRAAGQARFPDGVDFALRKTAAGKATQVEELMRRWEQDDFEAAVSLERPLAGWEIVVTYPDNDPVRAILGPTRWLYPMGLVALVATVMAGTVLTLNSAAREIRLSRLKTDFVSNVSHELRTPLTSIRLFVETLQSGRIEDPERIAECLDLLSQETDRLSRMIERVLSWARMEEGRRAYVTYPVSVQDVIDDALAALRSQLLLKDPGEIRVEVPPDLPPLLVDRDAIVEALVNLLQNAVKYCPVPREIVVGARRDRNQIAVFVRDNGPGVPAGDRKRIFEKFYQSDTRLSALAGADRGSGLGLSIVRAVVRGHGGKVELESEEGRGSTFTLRLPMA